MQINITAVNGIRDILTETNQQHGWQIPQYVVNYQARVLADKLDKNPWQPEPSYAERYMTLRTPTAALALADTCWFTSAVFPELKQRRGINNSYYVSMGVSCYDMVLKHSEMPAVKVLKQHFEFLAETTYTAIRHYGEFRSMWD
jgi:hypothetical protein